MTTALDILNGAMPDPGHVYQTLDTNNELLMCTAQAMANGVRNQINDNVDRLTNVEKRIRSSVNGHIRRNTQQLKPVVEGIVNQVHNGLDEVQGGVNLIAMRPEIQSWLAANPPSPSWAGIVPDAPQEGELAGLGSDGLLIGYKKRQVVEEKTYWLWYHCHLRQAIAVPTNAKGTRYQLLDAGWKQYPDQKTIVVTSEEQLQAYLAANRARLLQLCAAG